MKEVLHKEEVLDRIAPLFSDRLAAEVWLNKYAAEGEQDPRQMFTRLTLALARKEFEYYKKARKKLMYCPWLKKRVSKEGLDYYSRNLQFKDLCQEIMDLLKGFNYVILGGSMMASLGIKNYSSISNCFVIGQPEDSINGINLKRAEQSNLMKRRGGVGKDLSKLRPRSAAVKNAARTSTGAVSFMNVDSEITREIAQEGRRGALMITLSVKHPDILEFINAKQNESKITGANISVKVSNDFMLALEREVIEDNKKVPENTYFLRYPVDYTFPFDSIKNGIEYRKEVEKLGLLQLPVNTLIPIHKKGQTIYVKKVNAKEIWDTLVHCAWNRAEPGVMFDDIHINYSPDGVYDQYRGVTTNPCGEIFMQPYDSCRLLHHNLFSYIQRERNKDGILYGFDFNKFKKNAYLVSLLADDLVDLEVDALDSIINKIQSEHNPLDADELEMWQKLKENGLKGRRCGIGITALADAIAYCGYKYGSPEANTLEESIFSSKLDAELKAQGDMAVIRGTFDGWDRSKEFSLDQNFQLKGNNDFYQFLCERAYPKTLEESNEKLDSLLRIYKYGHRNISWSTVAPTGSVSILAGTTSGIEPLFLPYYTRSRKVLEGEPRDFTDSNGDGFINYLVVHPKLKFWIKDHCTPEEIQAVDNNDFKVIDKYFKESPYYQASAADLPVPERVKIQAIAQKYTTHSISSTINLAKETTVQTVSDIYKLAYSNNLKGVTVYRDGCRQGILNSIESKKEEFPQYSAPKRPKVLKAEARVIKNKGKLFKVIVGLLDNKPYEIFASETEQSSPTQQGTITKIKKHVYKWEGTDGEVIENIRLMSNNFEERACTLYLSMLLRHGVKIPYIIKTARKVDDNIVSFTSAICRVLGKYTKEEISTEEVCPDCGKPLIREGGCIRCSNCSYSACMLLAKQ